MSDNSHKKLHKKKKQVSDKSALVEEIIKEHKETVKLKPFSDQLKRKKNPHPEQKSLKKMKKQGKVNGNEETLPNSTMAFNNGLGSVSTPKKIGSSSSFEVKMSDDSVELGKNMMSKILAPVTLERFMEKYWERKHLHIKRNDPYFYSHLMSIRTIDTMLKNNDIEYTKNIDITSYANGERETKNPEGRAKASEVWDFYEEGCSIRILNPQTYIEEVYHMNSTIQEYFHCMTGTNVYLTPPNSQGFAPHYDDIEAFVLQIEGKKHWRLYNPRSEDEVLPRESSENFAQDEIGSPILDVILEPGDLLYFPRGIIHQANTVPGHYSLHITLSVYQKQSFGDFFEQLVAGAVDEAIQNDVEFRKGLPLDFHKHLGLVYSDDESPRRTELINKIKQMFKKLADHLPFDDAADQVAKKYQHDALPPYLSPEERALTSVGSDFETTDNGNVVFGTEVTPKSEVKLIKANIARMLTEDNTIRVYHHADNSKVYHEKDPMYMVIEEDDAPAVETLIKEYPKFIKVSELHEDSERAVTLTQDLFDFGLLMMKKST